ncbi:MAG: hypothetical protein U0Q15_00800 [Kineosporiaceae bacterium]
MHDDVRPSVTPVPVWHSPDGTPPVPPQQAHPQPPSPQPWSPYGALPPPVLVPASVPRRRRGRVVVVAAVVALVAAVALAGTGLALAGGGPDGPWGAGLVTDPRLPFDEALRELAAAPGVRYIAREGEDTLQVELTRTGTVLGTLQVDGQTMRMATVRGTRFFTLPDATARAAGVEPGTWVTGDEATRMQGQITEKLPGPVEFAVTLAQALASARADIGGSPPVEGLTALRARTPWGTIYVSKAAPHRLLRVEPPEDDADVPSLREGVQQAAWHADAGSSRPDLVPLPVDVATLDAASAAKAVEWVRATLPDLQGALTSDSDLELVGRPTVDCTSRACTVVARVRPVSRGGGLGGVPARLTASIEIDGEAAGACSALTTVAERGTTEVRCSSREAAGTFRRVRAARMTQARSRSAALGGASVWWSVSFGGQVRVRPLARLDQPVLDRELRREGDVLAAAVDLPAADRHRDGCPPPPAGARRVGDGWVATTAGPGSRTARAVACVVAPSAASAAVSGARPAGWDAARARMKAWGMDPDAELGACPLVPPRLGGGAEAANLVPCFRDETAGETSRSSVFEGDALEALHDHPGGHVLFVASPRYAGADRSVPTSLVLDAVAVNRRGLLVGALHEEVPNARLRGGVLRDLGE